MDCNSWLYINEWNTYTFHTQLSSDSAEAVISVPIKISEQHQVYTEEPDKVFLFVALFFLNLK